MKKRKYLSGSFRRLIWEKYNRKCAQCKCETTLFKNKNNPFFDTVHGTVDHIKPFSKGGECEEHNFQWLCFICNAKKKGKYV